MLTNALGAMGPFLHSLFFESYYVSSSALATGERSKQDSPLCLGSGAQADQMGRCPVNTPQRTEEFRKSTRRHSRACLGGAAPHRWPRGAPRGGDSVGTPDVKKELPQGLGEEAAGAQALGRHRHGVEERPETATEPQAGCRGEVTGRWVWALPGVEGTLRPSGCA